MSKAERYRNEWKYLIDTAQKELICKRLDPMLKLDKHARNGGYMLRSLYFDDLENTALVEKMARDNHISLVELGGNKEKTDAIDLEKYISEEVGLPTLNDIIQELAKQGRDPRSTVKVLEFAADIHTIEDLKQGMELPGIVGNITNFGAFVNIGIKESGLIHLSQMSDRYITDPNEVVAIHQHVRVQVVSIDTERKRIGLKLIGKQ